MSRSPESPSSPTADTLAAGSATEPTYPIGGRAEPPPFLHGQVLPTVSGVRLESFLGQGGMGFVYRGWHELLRIPVAVKFMRDCRARSDRFMQEASLVAQLKHRNIVHIHHAAEEAGVPYLILEYVDGGSLKAHLQKAGALPWRQATDLLLQAARGLAEAHAKGIVHRDVKPSNLMLSAAGEVKLADLGLAKQMSADTSYTQSTDFLGTAEYTAPEQARDPTSVSPAADIYSLGITYYQMLTGSVPFKRASLASTVLAHLEDKPRDIADLVSDLPPALADLTRRMLAKDPCKRPENANEVMAEIEAVIGAPDPAKVKRRSNPWSARIATFAVIACIALGTGWIFAPRTRAAVAGPASQSDLWQSPVRTIFFCDEGLSPDLSGEIYKILATQPWSVVERSTVAQLVAEQRYVAEQKAQPGSAVHLGKLLGGHLVLFGGGSAERVNLRCSLVETGQIAAIRVSPASGLGAAIPEVVAAAMRLLPAQGYLDPATAGKGRISLGSENGVAVGDCFEALGDDGAVDDAIGVATVISLDRNEALVSIRDLSGVPARVRVRRLNGQRSQ